MPSVSANNLGQGCVCWAATLFLNLELLTLQLLPSPLPLPTCIPYPIAPAAMTCSQREVCVHIEVQVLSL